MQKEGFGFIVLFLLIAIGIGCLATSCENWLIERGWNLPPQATNIKNIGNNYFEFDMNGKHYLYCHEFMRQNITEINKEIK
jgi:hypothetical protein